MFLQHFVVGARFYLLLHRAFKAGDFHKLQSECQQLLWTFVISDSQFCLDFCKAGKIVYVLDPISEHDLSSRVLAMQF